MAINTPTFAPCHPALCPAPSCVALRRGLRCVRQGLRHSCQSLRRSASRDASKAASRRLRHFYPAPRECWREERVASTRVPAIGDAGEVGPCWHKSGGGASSLMCERNASASTARRTSSGWIWMTSVVECVRSRGRLRTPGARPRTCGRCRGATG